MTIQLEFLLLILIIIIVIISNSCIEYSLKKYDLLCCIKSIKWAIRECDNLSTILFIMNCTQRYLNSSALCINRNDAKNFVQKLNYYSIYLNNALSQTYIFLNNNIGNKLLFDGVKLTKDKVSISIILNKFIYKNDYNLCNLGNDFYSNKYIISFSLILGNLESMLNNLKIIYSNKNKIGIFKFEYNSIARILVKNIRPYFHKINNVVNNMHKNHISSKEHTERILLVIAALIIIISCIVLPLINPRNFTGIRILFAVFSVAFVIAQILVSKNLLGKHWGFGIFYLIIEAIFSGINIYLSMSISVNNNNVKRALKAAYKLHHNYIILNSFPVISFEISAILMTFILISGICFIWYDSRKSKNN